MFMARRIVTHPWEFAVDPFHVAGNIYYVGNKHVCSYLVDTGEGLILFDTAWPQTVYLLLESVHRLGFKTKDIRYIFHSHAHCDHIGGTRSIVELTGAETFLGKPDIEFIEMKPDLTWSRECGYEFHQAFEVDHALTGGETFGLGNVLIECVGTPGHTPGSMSYFFEIEEKCETYVVGNHGGPGLNVFADWFVNKYKDQLEPFEVRRDQYLESLELLKKRRVDILIGLHPEQNKRIEKQVNMSEPQDSFIDSNAWTSLLIGLDKKAKEVFGLDEE